jgi:hypothetical protein
MGSKRGGTKVNAKGSFTIKKDSLLDKNLNHLGRSFYKDRDLVFLIEIANLFSALEPFAMVQNTAQ